MGYVGEETSLECCRLEKWNAGSCRKIKSAYMIPQQTLRLFGWSSVNSVSLKSSKPKSLFRSYS